MATIICCMSMGIDPLTATYDAVNGSASYVDPLTASMGQQKHECAISSSVSPIVANLYMEEVERKAPEPFSGTPPSHLFRYVDDTGVKITTHEVAWFPDHIRLCRPTH